MIEINNKLKERMAILTEKYHLEKTDEGNFKIDVNGFEITFHNFREIRYVNLIYIYQFKQQEIISLVCDYHDILTKYKDNKDNVYLSDEAIEEIQPIILEIFYKIHNIFDNMFLSKDWDSKETLETYFNYPAIELLMIFLDILDCIHISIFISLKEIWLEFESTNPEKAEIIKNLTDLMFNPKPDYNNVDLNNIKTIGNA